MSYIDNPFEGLDETTIKFYNNIYGSLQKSKGAGYENLETILRRAYEAKEGLRRIFNIPDDVGYIKLDIATPVSTPDMVLHDLAILTQKADIKTLLSSIETKIPMPDIRSGYIHKQDAGAFLREVGKTWNDPKHDVLSITKFIELAYDSPTSQIVSKIYNKQQGKPLYLSVRPIDYFMISDKDNTRRWASCHNSLYDGNYYKGNVDYCLDTVSFIVYSGNPTFEKYKHFTNTSYELTGINPLARAMCFANKDAVLIAKPYQDIIHIDVKQLALFLANKMNLDTKKSIGADSGILTKESSSNAYVDGTSNGSGYKNAGASTMTCCKHFVRLKFPNKLVTDEMKKMESFADRISFYSPKDTLTFENFPKLENFDISIWNIYGKNVRTIGYDFVQDDKNAVRFIVLNSSNKENILKQSCVKDEVYIGQMKKAAVETSASSKKKIQKDIDTLIEKYMGDKDTSIKEKIIRAIAMMQLYLQRVFGEEYVSPLLDQFFTN